MNTHALRFCCSRNGAIGLGFLPLSVFFTFCVISFATSGLLHTLLYICLDASRSVRHYAKGVQSLDTPKEGSRGLRSRYPVWAAFLLAVAAFAFGGGLSFGQTARPRITQQIANSEKVTLSGSRPAWARSSRDAGRLASGTKLQGMAIVFSRTAEQEADLQSLLASQANPASVLYHKWLSPDEFAVRFGMADSDISKIESWLEQQGFTVERVARDKTRVYFSGAVGQAESTFGTEIHNYSVGDKKYFAPSTDVAVPSALASVVQNVTNLSSFHPRSMVRIRPKEQSDVRPNFTSSQSGTFYTTPKDLATIYDVNAAYNAGYTGQGQSIAVVGQSSVELSDIEKFQQAAGLTVKAPTVVLVPNSGTSASSSGDEAESDLDLEYSGAMAPGANIYFVYTGNNQNYSVYDAIDYAVETRIAPIITVSYGSCETLLSSSDYTSLNGILQQGAAQGQSIIVASGDSGSSGCYPWDSLTSAQRTALAVSFPASSQYATAVGGTQFTDAAVASGSSYWEAASGSDVIGSAKSYMPEQTWNESSTSNGLSAGGGGASKFTARPSWQTGVTGISSGSYRLLPDISLQSAVSHAGFLYCSSDSDSTGITGSCSNGFRDSNSQYLTVAGGTSFAAPIFAGLLAVINQRQNSMGQGVINSTLYALASNSATYNSAFHDIISGGNQCSIGSTYCSSDTSANYAATTGYDQATGLGTIDFYNLMQSWPSGTSSTLTSSTTTLTAATGTPSSGASDVITITVGSGSASVSTVPTGTVSVAVDGTTVNSALALSSGSATYTFSSTTSGSHVITATYSGDSTFAASSGTVTVSIGSSGSGSGGSGGSGTTTVTVSPTAGYTGTVQLTLSTSDSNLQQYGCYEVPDATVTGTNIVSQTLTIYLGAASCAETATHGKKTHAFRTSSTSSSNARPRQHAGVWSLAGVALIGLLGLRRRRFHMACFTAVASILGLGLLGCGDSGGSSLSSKSFTVSVSPSTVTASAGTSGIPTGSYSLTITGADSSSSSTSASTTMTLVVN